MGSEEEQRSVSIAYGPDLAAFMVGAGEHDRGSTAYEFASATLPFGELVRRIDAAGRRVVPEERRGLAGTVGRLVGKSPPLPREWELGLTAEQPEAPEWDMARTDAEEAWSETIQWLAAVGRRR